MTPPSPLRWKLTEAAQQCGVSRTTIKRRLDGGAFPNAEKDSSGRWLIPVSDLTAAGFHPGKPGKAHPDPRGDLGMNQVSELEQLRHELATERIKREAAEQLADERGQRADALEKAMLMIEGGPRKTEVSDPEHGPETSVSDLGQGRSGGPPSRGVAVPTERRGFWGRVFGRK